MVRVKITKVNGTFFILCFVNLVQILSAIDTAPPSTSYVVDISGRLSTATNSEVYSKMVQLDNVSSLIVQIVGVSPSIKFLVMQAHSYKHNITASYSPKLNIMNHVNGTNLGLVYENKDPKMFCMHSDNVNTSVDIYFSIHAYTEAAPIPGGCNMELHVNNAPYLSLSEDFNLITLEAAPARVSIKEDCDADSQSITHDFYHMFMPESDLTNETYFDMIKSMITVEGILQNGRKVPRPSSIVQMRRLFSVYHGIGSVYGVIATKGGYSSAYVPNHSYASSIYGGHIPLYMKILFPILSLLGLFLCLCGHYYFGIEILILGFVSCSMVTFIITSNLVTQPIEVATWLNVLFGVVALSVIIYFLFFVLIDWLSKLGFLCNCVFTYVILYMVVDLPFTVIFTIAVIAGVVSSLTWLLCLRIFGIGLAAIVLASFCIGFQVSTIIYYGLPDGYQLLQNNLNFWAYFVMITFIGMTCIMPLTHRSNILACAILGSFVSLIAVELLLGSYLRYMFINVIRRAAVKNFNDAIIDPPYQWRDGVATLVWLFLILIGCVSQHHLTKNGPLFPSRGSSLVRGRRRRGNDPERDPFIRYPVLSYGSNQQSSAPPMMDSTEEEIQRAYGGVYYGGRGVPHNQTQAQAQHDDMW